MQADIWSPRIPIDPKLYKAAREGNINLLENHLRVEFVQQLQQHGLPIHVVNGGPKLQGVACDGNMNSLLIHEAALRLERKQIQQSDRAIPAANKGGCVLGRQLNCLLGVTYGGDSALHIAAYFGHLQVVRRIFHANKSLLLRGNNKSETPLHYAAQSGNDAVVSHFIEAILGEQQLQKVFQPEVTDDARELLRRRNRAGETALYQAVHNKHSAVVQVLINADPRLASIPDNRNVSPFYLAVMGCSPEVVALFIEALRDTASAEAYVAGPNGQTALHAAAFRQRGIVQKILDWKPDLAIAKDATGSTPLHYAASDNNIEAVQSLLENNNSSAYIADTDGLFPVHVAAKLGNLGVVSQLFELCPDSDELLDAQGRNFLHIAVEKRQVSVLWWAWKNSRLDRSINAKDNEGNTPMHLAVKARHLAIFALLLESKTLDLGIINKKGLTPFDISIAQNTHFIKSLLSRSNIIQRTLTLLRSRGGIRRRDLFLNKYKLELDQKLKREAKYLDNMAKSTSTVSVLIASASFAGIFIVSRAYTDYLRNRYSGNQSSGLNLAFTAFVLTVTHGFICSVTATGLSMSATKTYMDLMDRNKSLLFSVRLVNMAIRCLVMAFAFGAYVILSPLSKWLATLICLSGCVVPSLIEPMPRANITIPWAIVRSKGWKELWRRHGPDGRHTFYYQYWIVYFGRSIYLGYAIVIIVLVFSLLGMSSGISGDFLVLTVVITIPLFLNMLKCLELLFYNQSN